MTNKDLMQALGYARSLLYRCPFSGDQVMVVAECVRVLDRALSQLNEASPTAPANTDKTQSEQEG